MRRNNTRLTFSGFLLFFLTNTVAVSSTMWVYAIVAEREFANGTMAVVMFLVILFLAVLFTLLDKLRRRMMVERPVEKILSATERIAVGDFSVRLEARNAYGRYDEFDVIMENLNTVAIELGKSELLKNDFLSNVSHELKTPLSIIKNYAALLQDDTLDSQTRKKYAKTLSDASKRLSDLVTNILKLNKMENQKILPEQEKIRLDEHIAECIFSFEDKIEEKALEIETDFEEIEIFSVSGYLELVWNNLLSNAIKFTQQGGRVALTLKKDGKNAVVCVKDTGCGIDAETGKHIFDKFYQGDTSHSQEGNGLGLALVKKVIDILGGEISVQSEVGKGTTFTVVLKDAVV